MNANNTPPKTPPQQTFKLGMEPPSMLDPRGEPTYWMGIASIKTGQNPDTLLSAARLGDGHALATALWICSTASVSMLFQQLSAQAQKIEEMAKQIEALTKNQEETACPDQEG